MTRKTHFLLLSLSMAILIPALQELCNAQSSPVQIKIDPSHSFQTMDGFGVNFNGTYFGKSQRAMVDMLVKDLGATMFRLDPYGELNWETVNDNSDPKVMNWEYYNDRYSTPTFEASWSAGRYLNSLGIRPYLTLSGIPPAWMLNKDSAPPRFETCDSKDINNHLNPQMYDEFAETVVSLAMYARNTAHVDFQYFGPLNETDCYPHEGPRVDPDEMPIVLTTIANRLNEEGLGNIRIVAAEQANMPNDYIEQMLKNPKLMRSIGAFSLHSYSDTDATPHVKAVQESPYPNIPVWLTEYGYLDDLNRTAENEWKGFSVEATKIALRSINQGVTAALFWDAFDNYHKHYPRMTYYGLFANHNHHYVPKKRYYAAKQLYHFVHVGAQRIAVECSVGKVISGSSNGYECSGIVMSGFLNGDAGSLVLVGVQESGPEVLTVVVPGHEGEWQVFQTTPRLNCEHTSTVVTSNGSAQIHLDKNSIFTLVLNGRRNSRSQ